MTTRRARPCLEELGPRVLPSVSALVPPPAGFGVPRPPVNVAPPHALAGNGKGYYAADVTMPDAGAGYTLYGAGHFAGLGDVFIYADVHGVGLVPRGHADGTLTLLSTRGTLTLTLDGPLQNGFAPLPSTFAYHVTGGTGAYHGLHADGTLQLQLHPAPGSAGYGTFTITL